MRTKNAKWITDAEREHMRKVKESLCAVCDGPGGQAHHINQGDHWTTVGCCPTCHQNWHGTKELWRIRKLDELRALNITLGRVYN